MPWYRAYVDRKITDKGGGEHVRVLDGEAKDAESYEKGLKLKKDEAVGQVVELTFPEQAHVE